MKSNPARAEGSVDRMSLESGRVKSLKPDEPGRLTVRVPVGTGMPTAAAVTLTDAVAGVNSWKLAGVMARETWLETTVTVFPVMDPRVRKGA